MMILNIGLAAIIIALIAYIYRLKKQIKTRKNSKDLNEFIGDLTRGMGVIVMRVDPENILLRSPR